MKAPLVSLILAAVIAGGTALAQTPDALQKPNLSGTWVFNAKKSKLKVPAPTSLTLQIEQHAQQVSFSRTQVYSGQNYNWKLETVANPQQEVVQNDPQYTAKIRVYWQGDALVLDQKLTASDGTQATDVVTFNLEGDGRTLVGVERQETAGASSGILNRWVYERQGQ